MQSGTFYKVIQTKLLRNSTFCHYFPHKLKEINETHFYSWVSVIVVADTTTRVCSHTQITTHNTGMDLRKTRQIFHNMTKALTLPDILKSTPAADCKGLRGTKIRVAFTAKLLWNHQFHQNRFDFHVPFLAKNNKCDQ